LNTLRAKSNYAYHLQKRGKLTESEALFKAVVDQRHVSLGRDHPETLRSRCHLAQVLAKQGDKPRMREAEAHLRVVAAGRDQNPGKEHPDTLTTLSHLAVVLERLLKPEEAAQKHEEVWTRLDGALPMERRRARAEQGTFASSLEPSQAGAMLRQVAERRQKSLGADHADSLRAMAELASHLSRQGEAAEALELRRKVAERSEAALGPGHVASMAAQSALATSLRTQGGSEAVEAERIHQEVLVRMTEALNQRSSSGDSKDNGCGSPTRLAVIMRD